MKPVTKYGNLNKQNLFYTGLIEPDIFMFWRLNKTNLVILKISTPSALFFVLSVY